jgi:rare lipoprotein A (peptidoglycan hydrolase)
MGTERNKRSIMLAVILTAAASCAGTPAVAAIASTGGAAAVTGGSATSSGLLPSGARGHALATWFGPGFYGKRTACGQVLTQQVIGVAHRTLPCGSLVQLTYRGHILVAPVIDRGPYTRGVTWDLTAHAARTLGLGGTARIGARLVGQVADTPLLGTPAGSAASPTTGGNPAS